MCPAGGLLGTPSQDGSRLTTQHPSGLGVAARPAWAAWQGYGHWDRAHVGTKGSPRNTLSRDVLSLGRNSVQAAVLHLVPAELALQASRAGAGVGPP